MYNDPKALSSILHLLFSYSPIRLLPYSSMSYFIIARKAIAMASTLRLPHSPQPTMARTEGGREEACNVLLSFNQLPKWHQDNEFILHGYRSISGSGWISFRSWLYIHNESVNIYSHLVPTIIFLLSEWYLLQYLNSQYSYITSLDIFIFSFFIITVIICLGLSTTYHTLMNHSSNIEKLWLQFDLVGIVILILGIFISGIYMVFWCEPLERKLYWLMVSYYNTPCLFTLYNINFDLVDWNSWFFYYLYYVSSLFPRYRIPCFPNTCIYRDGLLWLCTFNSWN